MAMWRLTAVGVAASLIVAVETAAAGFWLPPDFGANNPNLAVAVGDSITLGTLGSGGQAAQPYPLVLQSLLAPTHPGFVVLNHGKAGETTQGGLTRLATILVADHPGFVLIMEGTNDATFEMSPDVIVANLREMVRLAKANLSIPLLAAIVPNQRDAPDARGIIAAVNARLPGVAAEEGVRFVDTFTPLDDPQLYGPDLLHPTQQGYTVLGTAWQAAVSAAITESRAILGGVTVAGGNVEGAPGAAIITGAGPGGGPHVKVFSASGVQLGPGFLAYSSSFIGGVRIASGCDFDGDGRDEIVTGAGPGGGPHVRVFRVNTVGTVVAELAGFMAYDPAFTGGVFVACGDVDGDGVPEIVTGAGRGGGPHVRVLRYTPSAPGGVGPMFDFFAYTPAFTGGVQVAVGNVDGSDRASLITGAGAGGGPHVRAIKLLTSGGTVIGTIDLASFFAYSPAFPGGVFVAGGDLSGDGRAELITGAGPGGGPHVRIFDTGSAGPPELAGFVAYHPGFRGGAFVGVTGSEVLTGAGPGGGPHVRGFDVTGAPTPVSFLAY
jgi:lysophospholipase L1-like esterase